MADSVAASLGQAQNVKLVDNGDATKSIAVAVLMWIAWAIREGE